MITTRRACPTGDPGRRLLLALAAVLFLALAGCDRAGTPEEADSDIDLIDGKYCGYLDVDLIDGALSVDVTRARASKITTDPEPRMTRPCFITDDDLSRSDRENGRIGVSVSSTDSPDERNATKEEIQEGLDGFDGAITCVDHPRFEDLGLGHACPGRNYTPHPDWATVLILFGDGPAVIVTYNFRIGTLEEGYETAIDIAVNARDNLEIHNPWADEFGPARSGRN